MLLSQKPLQGTLKRRSHPAGCPSGRAGVPPRSHREAAPHAPRLPGAGGQLLITAARSAPPRTTASASHDCRTCAVRSGTRPRQADPRVRLFARAAGVAGVGDAKTRSEQAETRHQLGALSSSPSPALSRSEARDSLFRCAGQPPSAAGSLAVRGSGTFLTLPWHTSPGSLWRVLSYSTRLFVPATQDVLVRWATVR